MAIDTCVYERQRRGINEDYGTKAATNAYSRFITQQRGERGINDYTQSFQRKTPGFTAVVRQAWADRAGGQVRHLPERDEELPR